MNRAQIVALVLAGNATFVVVACEPPIAPPDLAADLAQLKAEAYAVVEEPIVWPRDTRPAAGKLPSRSVLRGEPIRAPPDATAPRGALSLLS